MFISYILFIRITLKELKDSRVIAESFCSYFSNITNDLRSKLPSVNSNFSKLREFIRTRRRPWDTQFRIPMVTEDFVRTQLLNLKVNSATGIDNLGAKLLSCAASIIAPHIARICYLSITCSTMPKRWKFARVTAIFKGDDHTDMNCYRPISILPLLSKILERHVRCFVSIIHGSHCYSKFPTTCSKVWIKDKYQV